MAKNPQVFPEYGTAGPHPEDGITSFWPTSDAPGLTRLDAQTGFGRKRKGRKP